MYEMDDNRLSLQVNGYHIDKGLDDPFTIDCGKLESQPSSDVPNYKSTIRGIQVEGARRATDVVIPYKGFGQVVITSVVDSYVYGHGMMNNYPLCYHIGMGVWYKKPHLYPLCYTRDDLVSMDACEAVLKGKYVPSNLPALNLKGVHIVKALSDQLVSADQLIKEFNNSEIVHRGKLVKQFTGGWTLNGEYLNVSELLAMNE